MSSINSFTLLLLLIIYVTSIASFSSVTSISSSSSSASFIISSPSLLSPDSDVLPSSSLYCHQSPRRWSSSLSARCNNHNIININNSFSRTNSYSYRRSNDRLLQTTTSLQSSASATINNDINNTRQERIIFEFTTLLRVLLPAIFSGILAFVSLPTICYYITNFIMKGGQQQQLGMLNDAVTSFISLIGLLYSILVGQVFGFLYSQQEALYYALFDEVTEAKSLLEQVALVSQGRTMYATCLNSIARYVKDDLLGGTLSELPNKISSSSSAATNNNAKKDKKAPPSTPSVTPSLILSARPADDPLEAILYLTSVGIPGQIYDTVRSLRQARSKRLGALQRKVPVIHLIMLGILGTIMIGSFPLLVSVGGAAAAAASTSSATTTMYSGELFNNVMTLQGGLFGVATFAVVMTKMVLRELWRTKGGAYNVDAVLRVMVRGLQKELNERMIEAKKIMKRKK